MEEYLVDKMKTNELRKQLEIKGLNTKGLKADLLKRLKDHWADERKNRFSYKVKTNVNEEKDCPISGLRGRPSTVSKALQIDTPKRKKTGSKVTINAKIQKTK
jgi:hypothetical protein